MTSNLYAVFGNPVDHSLSPVIHQAFAKQFALCLKYEKITSRMDTFDQDLRDFFLNGSGANVTHPFKALAFSLASRKTGRAMKAKAANTLWLEDADLCADNTDGIGFIRDINRHLKLEETRLLILGAGGAARGILAALSSAKVKKITVAARDKLKLAFFLKDFRNVAGLAIDALGADYDLVINATSSHFSKESLILPDKIFLAGPFFYDLNYTLSKRSSFLEAAVEHNCPNADGLGMLVEQAAEAFYLWHQLRPDTETVLKRLKQDACLIQ